MKSIRFASIVGLIFTCLTVTLSTSCKKATNPNASIEIPELKLKNGQTIRTIIETLSEGGTMQILGSAQAGNGEMFIQRVRVFDMTKNKDHFVYDIQKNDSVASLMWKKQDIPSETKSTLIGRPITAVKKDGQWVLQLTEGNASPKQMEEIKTFEAHANRGWHPRGPVKIGDSWTFEPKFISHIIHKDLENVEAIGTLTLLAVEDGNAAISVKIKGGGTQVDEKGSISKADIDLTGSAIYSLETGLEIALDMKGHVTSGVQHTNGEIKAVRLPLVIKDRKKILD